MGFAAEGAARDVYADADRAADDPTRRELHIACGAAVRNARLGFAHLRRAVAVTLPPEPDDTLHMATLRAAEGEPAPGEEELYAAIPERHPIGIPSGNQRWAARWSTGCAPRRRIVDRESAYWRLLTMVREATLLEDDDGRAARARWVSTPQDADDGIPVPSLGPPAAHEEPAVRDLAAGRDLPGGGCEHFEPHPTVAVLQTVGHAPRDWLVAGQAQQNVLLTATVQGIAASFTN